MASAAEMLRRLQSVNKITVLRDMVYDEIIKEEDNLKFIKEEEYLEGDIYSNGTKTTYAWEDYAQYKNSKNPRAGKGNVDLINTGAFIDSFRLNKPKQNKYLWGATDGKRNALFGMYGQDIMSLNQNSFDKFQIEIIKPRFVEKLRKIINKK